MNEPKPIIVTQPSPTAVIVGLQHGVSVNVPLLVGTLAILAVLAGAGWFARGYFLRVNTSVYLEKAQQAEARGDVDAALKLYREYLDFQRVANRGGDEEMKHRAEILARMAALLEQLPENQSRIRDLYQIYEECLRLNRQQPQMRRRFVALLMQLPRFGDALSHLAILEETARPGADLAELLYLKGGCLEAERKFAASQQAYLGSIRNWPQQASSCIRLAQLWVSHPDHAASIGEEELPPGDQWQVVRSLLQPAGKQQTVAVDQAVEAVLSAMLVSRPGPSGPIAAARFLTTLQSAADRMPVAVEEAAVQTRAIFSAAEARVEPADGTGESPTEPLPWLERWTPGVPAFSDADFDGRVTREELQQRLVDGDTLSRLNWAEHLLSGISDAPETRQETSLAAIELLTARVEAVRTLRPADLPDVIRQARDRLKAIPQTEADNLRFLFARMSLEQLDLESVPGAEPLESLQQTESRLREILETQGRMRSSGRAEIEVDWSAGVRLLSSRWMEIELRYELAGVLLDQFPWLDADRRSRLREAVRAEQRRLEELAAPQPYLAGIRTREFLLDDHFSEAAALATEALVDLAPQSPLARQFVLLASECYERIGRQEASIGVLRKHLSKDPAWVVGRQRLAESLVAVGLVDDAIGEYRRLSAVPGFRERLLELLLLRTAGMAPAYRKWDEIESLVAEVSAQPDEAATGVLLDIEYRLLRATTDLDLARDGDDAAARRLLATAAERLEAVRLRLPERLEVILVDARFQLRRFDLTPDERRARAATLLEEYRNRSGSPVDAALLEAQIAVDRDPAAGVGRLLDLSKASAELSAGERGRLWSGLARLAAQAGNLRVALDLWNRVADEDPENLAARLAILQLLLEQKHPAETPLPSDELWRKRLEEIGRLEGTESGSVAVFQTRRRLATLDPEPQRRSLQLAEADEWLKVAERTRPGWSEIRLLRGLIAELLGRPDAALAAFEEAIHLGSRSPDIIRRVALHYFKHQEYGRADRLLQMAAAESAEPLSEDLARLAWKVSWNRHEYDRALGMARTLTEESDSAEDYIALALLQLARGETGEDTEKLLRKAAFELAPQTAEAWTALVSYYVRLGRWADAESAIAEVRQRLPSTPHPANLLAVGSLYDLLAAAGAPDTIECTTKGAAAFDAALEAAPDDESVLAAAAEYFLRQGPAKRAGGLLEKLLEADRSTSPGLRVWARQRLARLVASGGRFEDLQQAVSLLRSAVASGEDNSAENLRLQLELLERLQGAEARQPRLKLLLALKGLTTLSPDERLLLAELYDATGQPAEALHEFESLLELQPKFTRARVAYIASLLRQSADDPVLLEAAQAQVSLLSDQEPRSWQTTRIRAMASAAIGRNEEALQIVLSFVDRRFELAGERPLESFLDQEPVLDLVTLLSRDLAVRGQRADAELLASAVHLLKEGQRESAWQRLLTGRSAELLGAVRADSLRQAALFLEERNLGEPEALLRRYVQESGRPEAGLELASFLVRHNRLEEALAICEENWRQAERGTTAAVAVTALQRLPSDQRERCVAWRERLAKAADNPAAPDRWMLANLLGEVNGLLGSEDASIEGYRKAVAANPRDGIAWNNLAYLLARRNASPEDLMEAERAITEAIRVAGPDPASLDTRSVVFLAQGRPAEALAIIQPLGRSDASADVYFRQAECLWRLKRFSEGRAALDEARRRGWRIDDLSGRDRHAAETCLQGLKAQLP